MWWMPLSLTVDIMPIVLWKEQVFKFSKFIVNFNIWARESFCENWLKDCTIQIQEVIVMYLQCNAKR